MITGISLFSVWVTDIDEALKFYTEKLGFSVNTDITLGDGYRWTTVFHPDQPDLSVNLQVPGPPLDPESAEFVRRSLAKGVMHAFVLRTTDCRQSYANLSAKGVEFVQEPSVRPYGTEAVARDNSGNFLVLVQQGEYSGEDFPHATAN
ncbi:VOC family protein [Microlunatus soli]|uniref:Catechol 2,3-dioxygenase n=1 Tax=Microlunatus soli TaxID=630515 RepID=A0A1H1PB26_9ACTN|nr:VOC family protein [Microlunatus soli]SDS08451.1 Catechol 2,3-dioxygenase [Microlunatus soli]